MIELFRQFERESGIDVYGLGKDRAKWESALEKFAELIVRECADVVKYYHTRNELLTPSQLLQHFGVDE